MPSRFDAGNTARELRPCWTLVGIGGPIIPGVILAEEPELLVGRGDRPELVWGDVAPVGVDRVTRAAVDGDAFAHEEVELPAKIWRCVSCAGR